MLEIIGFLAGTIIVIILLLYAAWRFFLSGDLRTAILELLNIVQGRDKALAPDEHLSHRDREPLSHLVEERGHHAKQTMSIQRGDAMAAPNSAPQAPQPPQAIQQGQAAPMPNAHPAPHNAEVKQLVDNQLAAQPAQAINPPTAQPVGPPQSAQAINPPPVQPMQAQVQAAPPQQTRRHPGHAIPPLVETHSFGVPDPIIDDIHIEPGTPSADTLNAQPPAHDTSRFAVRSSTISPGRRIRDGRYRRNASS